MHPFDLLKFILDYSCLGFDSLGIIGSIEDRGTNTAGSASTGTQHGVVGDIVTQELTPLHQKPICLRGNRNFGAEEESSNKTRVGSSAWSGSEHLVQSINVTRLEESHEGSVRSSLE